MFEKNSRVCFLGDSITTQGKWIARIFDYYSTNLKDNAVTFYNCGVPGGTATAAIPRIDEDVLSWNPTHVVIMFGMNDGKSALYQKEVTVTEDILSQRTAQISNCIDSIRIIADKITEFGAKLIFCTPTPFDNLQICDAPHADYQECLAVISEKVKSLSAEYGVQCIDFNTYLLANMKEFQKADSRFSIVKADRVHPNAIGEELMADYFLKEQGFPCVISKSFEQWEAASNIPFSPINKTRFDIEQNLRLIAYVQWALIPFHQNNGLTAEEGLQKELDNPNTPNFAIDAIHLYQDNKDHMEDFRNKLRKHTDMMVSNLG